MGLYKYLREFWKNREEQAGELWRERLIEWRREPSTVRIARPTRLDRARSLGWKAKQGIIIVRQRMIRGGRQRPTIRKGRRPKRFSQKLVLGKSYQLLSEERAAKKFPNCEVLNSYFVAKDGRYVWYEVLLVDKASPSIKKDKELSWIRGRKHSRRVNRGLTSAGRKSRGLRNKGKGAEKVRPSLKANKGRAK